MGKRSVEKVGWLCETDPELNETGIDVDAQFSSDPRVDLREFAYEGGTRVKRSLVVSSSGDSSPWLLGPGTVTDKDEWASGRYSPWNPGMEWIADSFEELFRDEYETYLRLNVKD